MKPYLKRTVVRSSSPIHQQVVFNFPRIRPGNSKKTRTFHAHHPFTRGEIIATQRRWSGTNRTPVVRYQIVDAKSGQAVTNSVTVAGSRTVVLPFFVPKGKFRLRVSNRGRGSVTVKGTVLTFN